MYLNLQLLSWFRKASGSLCRQIATFNGSDQYIDAGTSQSTADVTWTMFIKTTSTANQVMLCADTNVNGNYTQIGTNAAGHLTVNSSNGGLSAGTIKVNDGVWHEIRLEINVTTGVIYAYVDEKLDFVSAHSNISGLKTGRKITIGAGEGVRTSIRGSFFRGAIRDVVFKTGSSEKLNIPINDGWANNPNIRDVLQGTNATMVNGTAQMWAEECSIPDAIRSPYTTEYSGEYM